MHKIYTLSTCDTSKRILKPLSLHDFEVKDIKKVAITKDELDEMKELAGSYEALFSRRSRSYIALGLKDKVLNEKDYEKYILSDYTFLKDLLCLSMIKFSLVIRRKMLKNYIKN